MSTGQVSGVAETGLFDIEPSATKLLLRIWCALADGFRRTMQRWSKVLKLVIRG